VFAGYFELMGIPLVAGRTFTPDDRSGGQPVVVVSAAMVRRDYPDGRAVGKHVQFQGAMRTIVGVVRDVKFRGLARDDEATVYAPFAQRTSYGGFVLRTALPPRAITASVRGAIALLDSRVTVSRVSVMDDLIRTSFAEERFRTTLVSLFGVLAALLAAIGMYGVTTRAVAGRAREVGIRVALGATPASVIGLIVRSTLGGVAIGVVGGVLAALVGARWAQDLLFEVDARDPLTYTAIIAFLGVVALLASWVPARRAARVHPAAVLRGE
jgi:putative ABC transport system permease protein